MARVEETPEQIRLRWRYNVSKPLSGATDVRDLREQAYADIMTMVRRFNEIATSQAAIEKVLEKHRITRPEGALEPQDFMSCSCEPGYVQGYGHVAQEILRAILDY